MRKSTAMGKVYNFERFTLDLTSGCLRAEDRETLRPKSFALLCFLVENADRLVGKDELMKAVWPNVFVTDDSLKRCVSEVRLALGDGEQKIVKTVPRRGFRFTATLSQAAAERTPGSGSMSAVASPATDWPALSDKPSIAVLPFQNLSSDPEQEYFADGVIEDIIAALARYPRLFVVARNSSFVYRGKAVDIRQVGRDLGVRYVLEGSIRKGGDRIRITGQLIEAESGRHVWAEKYDGEVADIFELQDRITASVVGTIEPHIQKAEIEIALKKRPEDLTSYDLFLRAKRAFHLVTGDGLDEAVVLAERSLSIDPGFAAAAVLASRARAYRVAAGRQTDIDEDIAKSAKLAKQALEVDPIDVDVLANAGRIFAWTGADYEGALELIERALSSYPYSAYAWGEAGWVNMHCGRAPEALRCLERAIALSPRDPFQFDRLAWISTEANRPNVHRRPCPFWSP